MTRQIYSTGARSRLARSVEGPALVSELTQHGMSGRDRRLVRAGSGRSPITLPGCMPAGMVDHWREDLLKTNYGGWPFTPDTTWLNLQTDRDAPLQDAGGDSRDPSRKDCEHGANRSRLAQFFMPTVLRQRSRAATACTGSTARVVRDCCDNHDLCYCEEWLRARARGGSCGRSWSCDRCNIAVVGCFFAGVGPSAIRLHHRQGCARVA